MLKLPTRPIRLRRRASSGDAPTATTQRVSTTSSGRTRRGPSNRLVRRSVLAVLLVSALILTTISVTDRDGAVTGNISNGALTAFGPIETGLARAWQPFVDTWGWTTRLVTATSEQPRLERRIEELEGQAATATNLAAENERLRDMLGLIEGGTYPNAGTPVAATVIARPPRHVDRAFVIDQGTSDGVRTNDPVVTPAGLVGRISATGTATSRVIPIANRTEAVSAIDAETGAQGVIRPVSNDGEVILELAHIPTRVGTNAGDTIVTSGWSGRRGLASVYPRGIPIGTVTSVGASPADLFKTVQVLPAVDFDRISDVLVLIDPAEAGRG